MCSLFYLFYLFSLFSLFLIFTSMLTATMDVDLSLGLLKLGLLKQKSTLRPIPILALAPPPQRAHSSPRPSDTGAEARILTKMQGKA